MLKTQQLFPKEVLLIIALLVMLVMGCSNADSLTEDTATDSFTEDTTPPTVPLNGSVKILSASQLELSWEASTDNRGVVGYLIYRENVQIASTVETVYVDIGLDSDTQHTYTVAAYDAAQNISELSAPFSGTTAALGDLNIPITVQEALPANIPGRDRANEPVTVGIPLLDSSNIQSVDQLGLMGSESGQFRVLSRYPSGNVKWVLVDFQASLTAESTSEVVLSNGVGNFGGSDLASDNGESITIDTDAAQFTIPKSAFNLFSSVQIAGEEIIDSTAGGVFSLDENNISYCSANDSHSTAEIEENGPVRAVVKAMGRLMSAEQTGHLWYTARLSFFKNADYVKITLTYKNADIDLRAPQYFNALELKLKLANTTSIEYNVAQETPENPWNGNLNSGQAAYLYQGHNTKGRIHYDNSCYIWDPPVAGTCDENFTYEYDTTVSGLTFVSAGNQELSLGDESRYTQGWANATTNNGWGAAVAYRWMNAYWPSSFEIDGDGEIEIGLYSKYNAKTNIRYNWGTHESRELIVDFHQGAKDNSEGTLYLLQYPLVARAAFEQYQQSGAFFNQKEFVTVEEERTYFENYGYSIPSYFNYSNPSITIRRAEHWRRGYSEHERNLLQFIRTGFAGYYLYAEHCVRFNADVPTVHSDGFDLREYPDFEVEGAFGQNKFDVEHQETMSFPMYYFFSGDERVRDAIFDYGEYEFWSEEGGYFSLPGSSYFRAWCRRFRNFAWLYEFTGDQRYIEPVLASVDHFLDSREDINNPGQVGRSLSRGFFWKNSGGYSSIGFRHLHSFFGSQIFGEAAYQGLRIIRENNDALGYQRVEDYEDALLGVAQFIYEEASWVNDNFYWVPYDYNFDAANELTVFTGNPYVAPRWAEHYYDQTGSRAHFVNAAQVLWKRAAYVANSETSRQQTQALLYTDLHQRPPRYGWQDLTVSVTDNGNGSYTLNWTVPERAQEYKIKYSDKEIVEWLGFDQITRTYQYSPDDYTPYFSASNVSDEPIPANVGTTQTYTIDGLEAAAEYHFSLKYR